MALYRIWTSRPTARGGSAKHAVLGPLALVAALLTGCGGDAADPVSSPTAVAVAGESFVAPVSKPLGEPPVAGASDPAVPAAPAAASGTIPTLGGKVRYGIPSTAATGIGAALDGTVPFAATDPWNRDVSAAPVDGDSSALIAAIGAQANLRPGFGALAGVPYAVVDRNQQRVSVAPADGGAIRAWPIPPTLGASADATARLVVLDRDAGILHELRGAVRDAAGGWTAVAGSSRRLDGSSSLPLDAFGADAADGGMPAFAGLLRRDEAASGAIRHALRVTVPALRTAWVAPATHTAEGAHDPALPAIGLRLRLRADVAIPADAGPQARAILQALRTYGMIVTGTGPALALEGAPDAGWDLAGLSADLARIRGADFEVLAADPIASR
jgi:hypothetical protein